jgi:hypothetical protein
MDTTLAALVGKPFVTTAEVKVSFQGLEQYFLSRKDRRAVFVSAYLQVTGVILQWIAAKRFQDNVWVDGYLLTFANLYRDALLKYETNPDAMPGAWRISFAESQSDKALVIQDLILGVHAHVNRDLAFALAAANIGPNVASRYADHNLVNDALDSVINPMQDRIAQLYSRGLGVLDHLLGPLDEELSSFDIRVAREHAWEMGMALIRAAGSPTLSSLQDGIDRQATILSKLILFANVKAPWIIGALRSAEEVLGWASVLECGPSAG